MGFAEDACGKINIQIQNGISVSFNILMLFLCFFRSEVAEVHFDQPWPTGGAWTVAQQLFAELQCQGGYQNTVGHSEIRRYRSH